MGVIEFFRKLTGSPEGANDEKLVGGVYQKFGYLFQNRALLIQALSHRSHSRNLSNAVESNERLEFLGDSILGMIVSEYLYMNFPDFDEGDLTKTKSLLVNEAALSMIGREAGLQDLILLSPEEEKSGGRMRSSIISDAVESVIGAVYLDGGLNAARMVVQKMIISRMDQIVADSNHRNYKGELLEYLQARGEAVPFYEVISESGPDHDKIFKIAVHTCGKVTGTGEGQSKKEAEQRAAAASLEYLKKTESLQNETSD